MRKLINTNYTKHIFFWIAYAIYFYINNSSRNDNITIGIVVLTVPYFAFVFYIVYHILERFFRPEKYVKGVISLVAFYILSTLFVYFVMHGGLEPSGFYRKLQVQKDLFTWSDFFDSLRVMHVNFTIWAILYYLHRGQLRAVKEKLAEAERRLQIEEERKQYEFAALASQVSPHLFANIFHSWAQQLHSLYPEMAKQVMETYELMKFYMTAHEPNGKKTILLHDELKAVDSFISIQQKTRRKKCYVDVVEQGNLLGYTIPPTSLLTLVENAFKHGDLNQSLYPLEIFVRIETDRLLITTENKKQESKTSAATHGYGLHNLKRRLNIVYGERADLKIQETETTYKVILNINF
ncbi:sensor histidine kinase [Sphingobacterium chuzhouense]|uniref:Histidine kinase n=1 Tax=Sphingobacterium chuzhouense TaxID=1742264 RepID=A0ABR7XTT0_9SPHI|nr:histidine kinase [Sphingobacterium chuzhouense]MBD1422566.1 histidine kinase [Sphingobacterium chuzhouense]